MPEDYADRAILVAILNRIADQGRALRDIRRVLKSQSVLGVEQRLVVLGLPRQSKVMGRYQEAGFEPVTRHGNQMHYLLTFRPRSSK